MCRYRYLLVFFLFISLAGCSAIPIQGGKNTPAGTNTPRLLSTSPIDLEPEETLSADTALVTSVATPGDQRSALRIWLPPQFDPEGTGKASQLLKSRLEGFSAENPDAQLEVRIKALEGPGGMLESMVAAHSAAPAAVPDLVLLPRNLLEAAALKGLIFPYDGLTHVMDAQGWFDYAHQLAQVKDSLYGIPFVGDALTLAYRASTLDAPPHNMETVISLGNVLLYPAADPQALYTLCMYIAEGGGLQDSTGRPMLDESVLSSILTYDQQASLAGVMPNFLTQLSTDAEVWESFQNDQYPLAVMWASTFLYNQSGEQPDLKLSSLPTINGAPFTLANGWSWALAGTDPDQRMMSVKLAEYLSEEDFVAEFSRAAGYLPPRIGALQTWQNADLQSVIEEISYSARLVPSDDLISNLGPAVEQALVNVLKAQLDPQTAAKAAAVQVNQP